MPIFDQGYQHWNGSLSSHSWRWVTIARQGVRAQWKSKFTRIVLIFALFPALGLAMALMVWGLHEQKAEFIAPVVAVLPLPDELIESPEKYRVAVWVAAFHFFYNVEMFFAMLLIVLVGPSLISQDLRFNAIPLYFSRPLRRIDYFLGKLGVIGFYIAAIVVVPSVTAYLIGVLFSLDFAVIRDTWWIWLAGILYGAVVVLSAGTLMLALSALSRSSRYVAMFWIGIWLVSNMVSGFLNELHNHVIDSEIDRAESAIPATIESGTGVEFQLREMERTMRREERIAEMRAEAARKNWRPLFSYTQNLDRIRNALYDTHGAFLKFGQIGGGNRREAADMLVPQYPWYWSAAVLAGLFGISVWILTRRVKSLDRLK